MRGFKVAVILCLAMVAGCSVSAGISRGQELQSDNMPSVLNTDRGMRKAMNSTVRLRAKNASGSVIWMGSGNVFKKENGRLHILSNNHVCLNEKGTITAEFLINGKPTKEYIVRVDLCVEDNGVDVAVVSLPHGKTLDAVPAIPIRDHKVAVGDEIFHVGCDAGHPQNAQLGSIVDVSDDHFLFWPAAYPGDSGSSIVQFDGNNQPFIVGLVAWQTGHNGRLVGMAMKSRVVLEVLAGGKLPDLPSEGDVPPSNLETERLIQGLLERLREMRQENKRERESLRDRLSQMQLDNALESQNTQLWRDRFKKQQDEQIERAEESQDSIVDRLSQRLDNLKTLLKWAFYGLVGLLIAALFFKQGWATTVIISIVTFVARTIKLAYLLIHNAIVAKVKNPKTMSEALEDLQDGISEGIGTKEDAP
jgi:hypothetical protein